ncbi:MAG TPA: rRNA maturation RNase YbeY [candidate division Zixibacteria bacterium]|nr:rRNA maturation RNase YbeY [candidate division Zixibacteria bacterium]
MSQFEIVIQCAVEVDTTLITAARRAAKKTLTHESAKKPTSLTLLLADNNRLQQLNRDFLGYDYPTDVLSFPSGESWNGTEYYLGDIAISISKAETQAREAGHDLISELCLLVVHGVLHLLDYDHSTDDEAQRMGSVQAEILGQLGLADASRLNS